MATDWKRHMEGWGGGGKVLCFSVGNGGYSVCTYSKKNTIFKLSAPPHCVRSLEEEHLAGEPYPSMEAKAQHHW